MNRPAGHRPLRSFVRREGRMTGGQQRALERLWPVYGVDLPPGPLDLAALFGRAAPCVLDIGFGNGETLVAMAAADPDRNYLGVEVHRPGVGHCLLAAEEAEVSNLRVLVADAVEVMSRHLAPGSLAAIHIYFPDPWPKKRHHKRRLIQRSFLDLAADRLEPGGVLHLATDWEDYAEWMSELLEDDDHFANTAAPHHYLPDPPPRPETKFERRGLRRGHKVFDLIYQRPDGSEGTM